MCLLSIRKTARALFAALGLGGMLLASYGDSDALRAPADSAGREPASDNSVDRRRYEWLLTRSAVTGEIPKDIRNRELRFVRENFRTKVRKGAVDLDWRRRGPNNVGGRTRALALDVTDENVVLAGGVSGGVWRSEDSGRSWTKTTAPELPQNVTAIVQDPRPGHTNVWYFATGEKWGSTELAGAGLFRSEDGGRSWSALPSSPSPPEEIGGYANVWRLLMNPRGQGVELYAATDWGIFRTRDEGESWVPIIAEEVLSLDSDIVRAPQSGVLYAVSGFKGFNPRIFRSEDGDTWTDIMPGSAKWRLYPERTIMAVAPSNENVVYLLTSRGRLLKYTYLSGDGSGAGGQWEDRTIWTGTFTFGSYGGYCMSLAVYPLDEDVILLGGVDLYRSTDGFRTRENAERISWHMQQHPDQHAIVFSPTDPRRMYASHDGGVSVTDDILAEKVEWRSLENGYVTTQFYTVAIDHTAPGDSTVLGGTQDNGTLFVNSTAADAPWTLLAAGDGGFAAIARDKEYYYISYQGGAVLRMELDADGNNADPVGKETRVDPLSVAQRLSVQPWVLNPANTNQMFYPGETRIWRNDNLAGMPKFGGQSDINWHTLPATEGSSFTTAMEISTQPPNRLYYAREEGQLFRLDKATGGNPVPVDVSDRHFPDGLFVWINSIAVDRGDADHMLVCLSNYEAPSIFFSHNGGVSWTDISGNLEENPDGSGAGPSVRWVEILNYEGTRYYFAGTSVGVFYTTELKAFLTEWRQTGAEAIGNVPVDMVESRDEDGFVVVATHGGGVYTTHVGSLIETAVEDRPELASRSSLFQNYPNPFSGSTAIAFTLDAPAVVSLEVFDGLGRRVVQLIDAERMAAGRHEAAWNASNLPSGRYVYRLRAGERVETRTAVVAR